MPPRILPALTLFSRQYCGLCEDAKETLVRVQRKTPFTLKEIDIDQPTNKQWLRKYMFDVPVVHVNGEEVGMHRISEEDVIKWLKVGENKE